jgi:hypothetical protein
MIASINVNPKKFLKIPTFRGQSLIHINHRIVKTIFKNNKQKTTHLVVLHFCFLYALHLIVTQISNETAGVNFTNVLLKAFMLVDLKNVKNSKVISIFLRF